MGRRSLFGGGGTVGHIKGCSKLADYNISMCHGQANGSPLEPRRSSRLRKITLVYEQEDAALVNLDSKQHQETCVSPTKQDNGGSPLYKSTHSPPMQNMNVRDVMGIDGDEGTINITLRDLMTRCTHKKRKASEINAQWKVEKKEHKFDLKVPKEEPELKQTLLSLKEKTRKSSLRSGKLNKIYNPALHSSPFENVSLLNSVALKGDLGEATIKETKFDELLANSGGGLRHKIESLNGKIKAFAEQSSILVGSPKSVFGMKKEATDTCLYKSGNENCTMNPTSAFVDKHGFDNKSLAEGLENISDREDLGQHGRAMSKIMAPFARDIIEESRLELSSSSASRLDNRQIPNHDVINVKDRLVIGSIADCELKIPEGDCATISVGSMEDCKLNSELPTKVLEKDDQHELQFVELLSFDKESKELIAAENSSELVVSDCEKLARSLDNERWFDGNRKHNLAEFSCNKVRASLVSEFRPFSSYDHIGGPIPDSDVSLSIENHVNFVDGAKHCNMDRNNCLDAINSHKLPGTRRDGINSMVYGDCCGQVSKSATCIHKISQMDCGILPSNSVALVNSSCPRTKEGPPCVGTCFEDGNQASHIDADSYCYFNTEYYLLDADRWSPQPGNLLPSLQEDMSSRCLESRPFCANISDFTDSMEHSGQSSFHFPLSELHDIDTRSMDLVNDGLFKSASFVNNSADLPNTFPLDSSAKMYVEKQIANMQTTDMQEVDINFGGSQCIEAEYSAKKLLSNRKEISPNSQKKLIRALNNDGLDDVLKLSNSMHKLCFDKRGAKKPLSSYLDNGETFIESEQMIKKPKTLNKSPPEVAKGILKSPYSNCCNPCCLKNSSVHGQTHDAILFSQRQMQDTENIAAKLLQGLNSLKGIVEETVFSGSCSFPSDFNFDEIRIATKHASKLESTTKKWLAMMSKDCTRFCKIMRLAENKLSSPTSDLEKGRKKITFADEAGGTLCHVKVYEQQPVAFIVPKS